MRIVFFVLALLFSFNISAYEKPQISQEILESSEGSILGIIAGRAYFKPEKLMFSHGQWFLQTDLQQWASLGTEVSIDDVGFYLCAKAECPRGHPGFKKVQGTWYCLEDHCPYFYGDHF